jgi:hypothetical protein
VAATCCLKSFDPGRGFKFTTMVGTAAHRSMTRFLEGWHRRELPVHFGSLGGDCGNYNSLSEKGGLLGELEGHLATYDNEPNETASVEKYLECVRGMKGFEDLRATLGLDGDQKTQRELARKAGITHQGINERVRKLKERIRKIHGDELKAML